MIHSEASGQRFIAVGKSSGCGHGRRAGQLVSGLYVPASGDVPNWMVRMMAPFSARSGMIVHELDRDLGVSAAKVMRVLGWQPRSEKEAICASAQSLIDHGLIAAL